MLQALLRRLQLNSLSNTNISTNINSIEQTNDLASELSNNVFLDFLITSMGQSSNTIIHILYLIIKDNPYAIFLVIVMSVFLLTVILRLIVTIFTHNPKHMQKRIAKRLLNTFLSSRFIWTGFLIGILVGLDVLSVPLPIAYVIRSLTLSILWWIFHHIISRLLATYSRGILIFYSKKTRLKFVKNKNVFLVISRSVYAVWFLIFVIFFVSSFCKSNSLGY